MNYLDKYFIFYFLFNLFFVIGIFDVTMIFCDSKIPCSFLWITEDISKGIYEHAKENDLIMYNQPIWYMVTIWFGLIFWTPFHILATYAFIMKKNWIRIPCTAYSSVMFLIMIQGISEQIWGIYPTSCINCVLRDNFIWLITPIILIIRMKNQPFKIKTD